MKFSPDFIEKVQDANNLVDLVGQFTEFKTSGRQMMGRCPFPDHKEKTPSFSVSEDKQVFHCFGCQKSGNIFHFVEYYFGYSFRDALIFLAQRAGIELPQEKDGPSRADDVLSQKKKALLEINRLALQFFQRELEKLPEDHGVKSYMASRGLDPEMVRLFHLGYAPEDWESLAKFLSSKGCSMSLAEEAGLVKARTAPKSGYYDIFKNRLMFPILSQLGDCIGFGGRILDQGQPKYLNSPETLLFNKSKVLYGLQETGRYIRSEDRAVIVEGYMDLIALYRHGIKAVVAPLGTALTADHVRFLRRMTPNIVVLFDGDSAGQRAAERSLPLLLGGGALARGLTLPDQLDPDDYLKAHGEAGLKNLLNHSQDLFMLILERWMVNYRGEPVEKVHLADRLKEIFVHLTEPRLHSLYMKEVCKRMGVDEKWLSEALGIVPPSKTAPRSTLQPPRPAMRHEETSIQLTGAPAHEILLLRMALSAENRWQKAAAIRESLQHLGLKNAFIKAEELYRQDPQNFAKLTSRLTNFLDRPELLVGSSGAFVGGEPSASEIDERLLVDCINKVRNMHLKREAQLLATEIRSSPHPEKLEKVMSLAKNRLSLNRKK